MIVNWPHKKAFAFSIWDDPDQQSLQAGREVYACLADLGYRTTKGVWPVRGPRTPSDDGGTCDESDYLQWVQALQANGFEIGYHNATLHTSTRRETLYALERFRTLFGASPMTMSQHHFCDENLYWGDQRVTGVNRIIYNLLTRGSLRGKFTGHVQGHDLFWGDACKHQITYVRNFVFGDINTLAACPLMPYHDPDRPLVPFWFASSEGADADQFIRMVSERNQERLAASGGCCIMYTHFGKGFVDGGLNKRFVALMTRLRQLNGWFVPVATILDHLRKCQLRQDIRPRERSALERRWMLHKFRYGSA